MTRSKRTEAHHAQTREWIAQAQAGDARAIEALLADNERLIYRTASFYYRQCQTQEFEDVLQMGRLGLLEAIRRFDLGQPGKFSTYAIWQVRGFIARLLRVDAIIRVPQHVREGKCRSCSAEEAPRVVHSLDAPMTRAPGDERTYADFLVAPDDTAAAALGFFDDATGVCQTDLDRALAALPEIEATVIRLRFGLDDDGPYTLAEVGQRVGYSREGVRHVEVRAIKKLRQTLKAR